MRVLFWISLWVVAIIAVSSSTTCLMDTDSLVKKFEPKKYYGSLNPFYSINKGISDGLQKTLNYEMLTEVYNFINNSPNKPSIGKMINDIVKSQAGAIAFFCGGLLIILISLVMGITVCSCRCCCNSCGAEKDKRKEHSIFGAIVMIFGLLASFGFILTGVIIFNLSANNFYTAIDSSTNWTSTIINQLNSFVEAGTSETECVIGNSVNQTFGNLTNQMVQFPNNLTDLVLTNTGVQELETFDYNSLNNNILNATTLIAKILGELGDVPDNSQACSDEKITLKTILDGLNITLSQASQNVIQANQTSAQIFDQLNSALNTLNTNMNSSIGSAINEMNILQSNITGQMDVINTGINTTLETVWHIQDAIQSAQHDIVTWSGYKPVRASVQAIMSIPNCIAMVFCLLCIIGLIFWIIAQEDSKSWGYVGVFGFYFVIFLTIVAMGITSAAFVGGWAISGVCKPTFEDNTFQILKVADVNFPITGLNGTSSNVTAQSLMQNCYNKDTIFTAIGGDTLISVDAVNNMLNLTAYYNQIIAAIDSQPLTYSVNSTIVNDIYNSSTALDANVTSFNNQGFLADCKSSAGLTVVKNDIESLKTILTSVQSSFDQLSGELIYTASQANSTDNQEIAANYTTEQFNQAGITVNSSISDLINQLNTNVFPCYGLYQGYENLGTVVCDWLGRPVQGMWGAAGLAAIFFIPLAIILLCASNVIFNGYRQVKPIESDEIQPPGVRRTKVTNDPWSTEDDVFPRPVVHTEQPLPATRTYYDPPTVAAAAPWMDSDPKYLRRHDEVLQRSDDNSYSKSGLRRLGKESGRFQDGRWEDDDEDLDSYNGSQSKSGGLRRMK